MIIQCEKCQTRFKLDDSRITGKGVKVRCTKCKNVFIVQKDVQEAEPFESPELPSPATEDEVTSIHLETPDFATQSVLPDPIDPDVPEKIPSQNEPSGFDPFEASSFTLATPSFESVDTDFFAIENTYMAETESGASAEETFSDFNFSDDEVPDNSSFKTPEIDLEVSAPETVQQVIPDDLNRLEETFVTPNVPEQEKAEPSEQLVEKPLVDNIQPKFPEEDSNTVTQEELPPLSINSRRKNSPVFPALISIISLFAILVLGYFGYSSFSIPKELTKIESGKIGLRAIKASFIANNLNGELLAISGEAVNEYSKPRAALQLKVTVFDATGQSIATKSLFCGNPLTEEQLKNLPLDKIEAIMTNQFGDSLSNMEVTPGKAIPFVAAIANLPKDARDFTVQPIGSTVATGKSP